MDLAAAVLNDRSPEKLRFFGNDPGDHVTFHLDADLAFSAFHDERKMARFLVVPRYFALGSGNYTGAIVNEEWKVRVVTPDQ